MARVRLSDVARAAGVSQATASLVLNNREARISDATRARVIDAAAELGYMPNALAQGLRTRQTRTVGLISDMIATTPFAGSMIAGVDEVARENGHLVFIINTDDDERTEGNAVKALLNHQVDKIIYATMWHQVIEAPEDLPIDSVLLDCRDESNTFRAVVPDDFGGGLTAGRALVAAGHTRIAYLDVDTEPRPPASDLRYGGLSVALYEAGIQRDPALRVPESVTGRQGQAAAGALLDLPPESRPTAIFAFNDRAAMGVYAAAAVRGLNIPADLSVIGYDDQQELVEVFDPPLTTLSLPHLEMGRWAMEVAVGLRTHDPANGPFLMPCELISRESVGPPFVRPGSE